MIVLSNSRPAVKTSQHRALVQGNVIGLIALDFVLWFVRAGVVNVTFVVDVALVHLHDFSTHAPRFRIPAHVVADLESLGHGICSP